MTDEPLTPRQVAEELGVTVRTVQRWIRAGRLPATRVGGRLRLSRSSLSAVTKGGDHPRRPIRSLLIANRGEIAARVARTARGMGIRVVRVHAADERRPVDADEAHAIASYLDGEELLQVAARAGVDALHPGYGFLAENPDFAAAVDRAGLAWIGPPPEAIAAMGDKAQARRRAAAHGVPVVPGYDGTDQDEAALVAAAERIRYPLLVKPSAGGGGKGMHVVREAGALPEVLAVARREASRAFGDDRLILERFVEDARHVEVQLLFDVYGKGVHFGERDCSTQRRSQKVVEEAPAPSVSPELRHRIGTAALAVAEAVGYANAGTVEFLLADGGAFYFIEMNTRLQVEHPVTEAVTGRDLVADQLRMAAGEPLGLEQAEVRLAGHAIEARLYAEDPDAGFLPATGRIAHLALPVEIRVDAGVAEGDVISERYDPLLAKLVAHGRDRREALARLRAGLEATSVLGVRTNLRFLRWLVDQPAMADGEMRTDTLAGLDLPPPPTPEERHWQAAAAALWPDRNPGPWGGGWRLNARPVLRMRSEDDERRVELLDRGELPVAALDGDVVHVDVEGQSTAFSLVPAPSVDEAARRAGLTSVGGASLLTAPMPGRVIAVRVAPGAVVAAHQVVVIIEAMKMEHAVVAPTAGRVALMLVREGQQVQRGDLLAEVRGA